MKWIIFEPIYKLRGRPFTKTVFATLDSCDAQTLGLGVLFVNRFKTLGGPRPDHYKPIRFKVGRYSLLHTIQNMLGMLSREHWEG